MRKRNLLSLVVLVLLAAALAFFKVPLASSQGLTLFAARVSGELPLDDPDSPLWQSAAALEVPLSAQAVSPPIQRETRIHSVTARALHNDEQVAFLVEWADETQDDQAIRVQDFRDAVALQFPQAEGQPFFCMGLAGGNVNIWHWKADWQADLTAWQDMETVYPDMNVDQYPFAEGELPSPADYQDANYVPALAAGNLFAAPRLSPVEDLLAGGFGTLTAQSLESQNVMGSGAWQDGRWRVIFSRELASPDAEDVVFTPGVQNSVAFAAWDGANGERNGEKSTSQWVWLQLEGEAAAAPPARPPEAAAQEGVPVGLVMGIYFGAVLLLFIVGGLIYFRLPKGG